MKNAGVQAPGGASPLDTLHTGDCVILVLHFQILDAVRRHGKLTVQCYGICFCIVCICLGCNFGIRHDPLECSVQLVASGGKFRIGRIDRHEDALTVGLPLEYKLVVMPGKPFHVRGGSNTIRLNFATPTDDQIAAGMKVLGRACRELYS